MTHCTSALQKTGGLSFSFAIVDPEIRVTSQEAYGLAQLPRFIVGLHSLGTRAIVSGSLGRTFIMSPPQLATIVTCGPYPANNRRRGHIRTTV